MLGDALTIVFSGLLSALVTFFAVPLIRNYSVKKGVVDLPDSRRVNKTPIPRLGGLAMGIGIMSATLIPFLMHAILDKHLTYFTYDVSINYFGVTTGVLIVFVLGIFDDIFDLDAPIKMLVQCIAAIIIVYSGVSIAHFTYWGKDIVLGLMQYPITVFYLVAFTNMINLIDGLDGLAAGTVAIAAAVLSVFSFSVGVFPSAILAAAIMGTCIAFLYYNFNPASIFMGDSGAMSLGMILGVGMLMFTMAKPTVASTFSPLVVLAFPILDTFCAIVRRIRSKSRIGNADKLHTHHRLFSLFGHRNAVIILLCFTGVFALISLTLFFGGLVAKLLGIAIGITICAVTIFKLDLFGTKMGKELEDHFWHGMKRGR